MIGLALGIGTKIAGYKGQGWPFVLLYVSRVEADGGVIEAKSCLLNKLNNI